MTTHQKKFIKRSVFLWIIIFSHILPVIVSSLYDQANHPNHNNVKLSDPRYWFWAFAWWSAWTSLLTVPWAIYKLLNLRRKKESGFKEQMWDIIVAEANFISGVIFCCGGFLLSIRSTGNTQAVYPLLGKVKPIYIWLFYNFFWHILAPGLTFYYFWKYCESDKLIKKKEFSLVVNLFNPTVYFLYVIIRPLVVNFSKTPFSLPYKYPSNYPYPPFFWIMSQFANREEVNQKKSRFFFLSWRPNWISGIIWLLIVIIFWYIVFSLLFCFLIKVKKKQNNSSFAS